MQEHQQLVCLLALLRDKLNYFYDTLSAGKQILRKMKKVG